jgi:hypothetical protein
MIPRDVRCEMTDYDDVRAEAAIIKKDVILVFFYYMYFVGDCRSPSPFSPYPAWRVFPAGPGRNRGLKKGQTPGGNAVELRGIA